MIYIHVKLLSTIANIPKFFFFMAPLFSDLWFSKVAEVCAPRPLEWLGHHLPDRVWAQCRTEELVAWAP